MNALVQTALRHGHVKSSFSRAFTELCVRATVEGATRQLSRLDVEPLYEAWLEGTGQDNASTNSKSAQLSKLDVFRRFGRRFGVPGVAFVQNWYDNRVPDVPFNMLPTELRLRLNRGYV
jgi:hypothetical protein